MTTTEQKKKVLLVDDDQFLVDLYKKNAEQYPSLEFSTATSGTEALKMLREGLVPDNILLDIDMPGMSGVDVLRLIREEKLVPAADITILSNTYKPALEEDFKKLGIQRFVPKAFLLPSKVLEYVVKGFGTDWAAINPA